MYVITFMYVIPNNHHFTKVNVVPLICEVKHVAPINHSADVSDLCLILNVELKFTGIVLQILDLNKTKYNSMNCKHAHHG